MGLRCARPWEIIWIWTTLQLESIAWKCFWWGIRCCGPMCRGYFRIRFLWGRGARQRPRGVSRRFARSWGRERSGTNAKDLTQSPQRKSGEHRDSNGTGFAAETPSTQRKQGEEANTLPVGAIWGAAGAHQPLLTL